MGKPATQVSVSDVTPYWPRSRSSSTSWRRTSEPEKLRTQEPPISTTAGKDPLRSDSAGGRKRAELQMQLDEQSNHLAR